MYLQKTEELKKTLTIARRHHWWFRELDKGGVPASPLYKNEWWFTPVDRTIIPKEAEKRIKTIELAGIKPVGFIIAHEAPKLLKAPEKTKAPLPEIQSKEILDTVGQVAVFMAQVIGYLALGFVWILGTALMTDPAVIVVLEDGTWVEVVRWFELPASS